MTSTLVLYKNCKIIPSKNFKVDDIGIYLNTLTKETITDFQYVKQAMNVSITVNMSQTALTYDSENNNNYVSIKNGTTGTLVYYFVKNKVWTAENTLKLDLLMDTINTFNDSLTISPKTKILRQHIDRFEKISSQSAQIIANKQPIEMTYKKLNNYLIKADDLDYRKPSIILLDLENNGFNEIFETQPSALEYYVDISYTFVGDNADGRNFVYYLVKKDLSEMQNVGSPIIQFSPRGFRFTRNNGTWTTNAVYGQTITIPSGYYFGIYIGDDYAKLTEIDIRFWYQTTSTHEFEITPQQFVHSKKFFAGAGVITTGITGGAKPLIDMYSEGIVPKLYGKEIQYLRTFIDTDWFLIYANQNDPSESLVNPVDCFIVPKGRCVITNYDTTFTGKYYGNNIADAINIIQGTHPTANDEALYIHGIFQSGCTISGYMGTSLSDRNPIYQTISVDNNSYLRMYRDVYTGDSHNILVIQKINYNGTIIRTDYIDLNREGTLSETTAFNYSALVVIQKANYSIDPTYTTQGWLSTALMGSQYSFSYLSQLSEIDRTDPKIIKCIELPYFPTSIVANEHIVGYRLLSGHWLSDYVAGYGRVLKIRSSEEKLNRDISFAISSNDNPFKPYAERQFNVSFIDEKNIENEPKLFNSDYYQPKVIYDSFGFIFQLELITSDLTSLAVNNVMSVSFTTTTTMNSRFMFTYNDYECEEKELQDYNNIMCVARNNELPLYNQQYINYLRAGYNYDVKNKQRTETFAWLGAGLSMAGAVASFASTGITGGFGVAMGISFTASALGTIANAINTTITQEQNFEIKQKQLQLQTTSVYGSDDVDLMNQYAQNRLKLKLYEVSPRMKQLLYDLFFYTGYISNTLGLPKTNTRTRFNFVSCELVFEQVPNLPEDIVEDIKNRYSIGLTFLHRYNSIWDFEQKYENWETSLVN